MKTNSVRFCVKALSGSQVAGIAQHLVDARSGTIHPLQKRRESAGQANMEPHRRNHARGRACNNSGTSRTFAAANPQRKEAVSSEKRPPTSPASTTKRALPPSPTNSGVRQPRPRASQCQTGSQHQGPYPAHKRWFGPSHLPLDRFSQPRSPEGTSCVPTSQQQHTLTCDGQGCREDGHIGNRVL